MTKSEQQILLVVLAIFTIVICLPLTIFGCSPKSDTNAVVTNAKQSEVKVLYHQHFNGNIERLIRIVDVEHSNVVYCWDAPGYGGGCAVVPIKEAKDE